MDDPVVQDWILKHGTPVSLHSDRDKGFTAALQRGVCDSPPNTGS